jgi:predicted metalloprotease with PDZ domain
MPYKLVFLLFIFIFTSLCALGQGMARYRVEFTDANVSRLKVTATLPVDGRALEMESSWPGDVPEVADKGWPALVYDLRVTDETGRLLETVTNGPGGWQLKEPYKGTLDLTYEVDYAGPSAANWPAPRETAFRDAENFVMAGRSLFITSPATKSSAVTFALPRGWHAVVPWRGGNTNNAHFSVPTNDDLTSNLVVFSKAKTEVVSAGGFRVSVTAMGHWQAMRGHIAALLRGVIPRYLKLFGASRQRENYSVVLLPLLDKGGESYRASFAYTFENQPTIANAGDWGHTVAHEIFHYWNGWRLRGADYPGSQWFQEGFTDYFATLATLQAGLIDEREFIRWINAQIERYRDLKLPLAKPGSHKGPPLYGGGALVALLWDIQIRHAGKNTRTLADAFHTLWRNTGNGARPYEWRDIQGALAATAAYDWDGFYNKYIDAGDKLPIAEVFPLAGLKLNETVEIDANATPQAKALRHGFGQR